MKFKYILFLFLLWRLMDFLIIIGAQKIIPYLGFFPYKEILSDYRLPAIISSLANFDGVHYLLIAKQGYSQYEQAFFPLYPLLIRFISPIFFNNHLLTGFILSNISFFMAIVFLLKYLKLTKFARSYKDGIWPIIFLLFFPASFFFGAVYTEGLFFFLFIASLYFLEKKNYFLAGFFAFFASLTRLMGVFLIIPIIVSFLRKKESRQIDSRWSLSRSNRDGNDRRNLIMLMAPIFGLILYSLYLRQTTGDPLFFLTSQSAFGANRSTSLVFLPQVYFRYLKIFLTANWNFQYFVSVFEFPTFTFVFVILIWDLIRNLKLEIRNYSRLSLTLFSLVNIVLPTLTGTFSSIPRYSLLSLSAFIFLGQLKNQWLKIFILGVFLILHVVLLGFFSQGYFVS